ncbi:MAG: hypothetical protein ACOY0T_31750 [Myxococcota bacterium]
MSARRGSLTLTRLFVKGSPPRDFRQRFLQAIRLRMFQPLKPDDGAIESSGWCVMERPFDLEFDAGKVYDDHYVMLGLRIDRFRIPAAMIRSQMADEEQRILSKTGKNRLSRNERLELRDKIVMKLRKKFSPSTRSIDMVWDIDQGLVMFFTHSRRVLADFSALFEKTFGLELDEDSPYLAAERAQLPERVFKRLNDIEPLRLSKPSAEEKRAEAEAAAKAESEAEADEEKDELFQRIETTRFLGPEFLLWIWLRGEFVNAGVELGEAGTHQVWLDRQLVLESPLDKNERVTIRGAAPADGEEAREAVRARKFPVRARIAIQGAEHEFATGLDAPRFAIASASVPSVMNADASEAFLERMTLAGILFSTLDQLYAAFLSERLSDVWQEGWEPAIKTWVTGESVSGSILQRLNPAPQRKAARRR